MGSGLYLPRFTSSLPPARAGSRSKAAYSTRASWGTVRRYRSLPCSIEDDEEERSKRTPSIRFCLCQENECRFVNCDHSRPHGLCASKTQNRPASRAEIPVTSCRTRLRAPCLSRSPSCRTKIGIGCADESPAPGMACACRYLLRVHRDSPGDYEYHDAAPNVRFISRALNHSNLGSCFHPFVDSALFPKLSPKDFLNRTLPPHVSGLVMSRTRLDHATRAAQRMYAAFRGSFGITRADFFPQSRRCCGSHR